MTGWARSQIDPLVRSHPSCLVVLDPDAWVACADLADIGEVHEVRGWYDLRRVWEREGRGRPEDAPTLVLLVHDADLADERALPFDVARASAVVRVRLRLDRDWYPLLRALDPGQQERAIACLTASPSDPLGSLLDAIWHVSLPGGGSAAMELQGILGLVGRDDVPPLLRQRIRSRLQNPLARALAADPPDYAPLQAAWDDWCPAPTESEWDTVLRTVGPSLIPLFDSGRLRAAPGVPKSLPAWAASGVRQPSAVDRALELLSSAPSPYPDQLAGWVNLARWWGDLRDALAEASSDPGCPTGDAWTWWGGAADAFAQWLQGGGLARALTSAARPPATVAGIASFLARRMRKGVQRILLVVDGMGFCQWAAIRRASGLRAVETVGTLAMAPTLTSLSRQAIFAGAPPAAFPEMLKSTAAESELWTRFWTEESEEWIGQHTVYGKVTGAGAQDLPDFGTAAVVGLVVNAVDDVMHGTALLGDSMMRSSIETWVRHGFLQALVERAHSAGYEAWLTADHGNIEAIGGGRPKYEGLAVESAGLRVRWYAEPALREISKTDGLIWDPPGLPPGSIYPLFAHGRTGYFTVGERRIAHGGISFDEMIVPLVRVER